AADEQPDGVDGEASEPPGEGDGKVLDRRGRGGHSATACGLPERRRGHGRLLGAPASCGKWATTLPQGRLTPPLTNHVVHPPHRMPRPSQPMQTYKPAKPVSPANRAQPRDPIPPIHLA